MQTVILASASEARRDMLEAAGVPITVDPARVDEAAVKAACLGCGMSLAQIAAELAALKAIRVSQRHPGALVIGADQVLDLDGALFDKPVDAAAARRQLDALRGQTHHLHSAAAIVVDGQHIWHHTATAALTMRSFTDAFLDWYVAQEAADVAASVGGYRLEGLGVQLFAAIDGDYFTVLGLPLLETIGFLRARGIIGE